MKTKTLWMEEGKLSLINADDTKPTFDPKTETLIQIVREIEGELTLVWETVPQVPIKKSFTSSLRSLLKRE